MKKLGTILLLASGFTILPLSNAMAIGCYLKSEETSPQYKICYYECVGSKTAITVKKHATCRHRMDSEKIIIK